MESIGLFVGFYLRVCFCLKSLTCIVLTFIFHNWGWEKNKGSYHWLFSIYNMYHLFFLDLFFFFFFYLYLAVLGLRFCARAFSSCGKLGPLFIAVRRPLTIAASLVAENRLQTRRLSNCGSRAQLLRGMWNLPRPGLKPMSPALAGRFSTTAPPGKPPDLF